MTARLSFAEICDYYQAVVYRRELLASSIADVLRRVGASTILDCACGTGLPAIDLREMGFTVECSDGDPEMLRQFKRNARARDIDDRTTMSRWRDLPTKVATTFDYVMCRGNSFVYATSWGGLQRPVASPRELDESLTGIASMVKPGGFLHIDLPSKPSLSTSNYPPVTVAGTDVTLTEHVVGGATERIWAQQIRIGSSDYNFTTNSAVVAANDVRPMLGNLGFTQINSIVIEGERPSYEVLLAQKGRT